MKTKLNITLPSYQEVAHQKFPMTDFTREMLSNNLNEKGMWLRSMKDYRRMDVYCPQDRLQLQSRCVIFNGIGVAPRFQNPAAAKLATTEVDGATVLTVNYQVVTYPQKRVPATLEKELNRVYAIKSGLEMQLVWSYHEPYRGEEAALAGVYGRQSWSCFSYQDQNYVRCPVYHGAQRQEEVRWYQCAPVRVSQEADGSLQCRDVLFNASYDNLHNFSGTNLIYQPHQEVNVAPSGLGRYLNGEFWSDLQQNITQKLTHPQNTFTTAGLKKAQNAGLTR